MASESSTSNPLTYPTPGEAPVLVLASQSPRRASLLREAGFRQFLINAAPVPDPDWPHRDDVRHPDPGPFVAELAIRKAMSVADTHEIADLGNAIIVAADTLCVDHRQRWLGKPRDAAHATSLLKDLRNRSQTVWTGVAIVRQIPPGIVMGIRFFTDEATVQLGDVSDDEIDRYVASNQWRGKAGGYNITELIQAGWPITVTGDHRTVVGLPIAPLRRILAAWNVTPSPPPDQTNGNHE